MERKKLTKKYIFLLSILFVLAIIPGGIIFYLYQHYLGGISKSADDWASFGSLLGGYFTYIAAIGTIGTLSLLIYQQDKNNSIINKQLAIQTFTEYENHRKLFFGKLSEIERHYNNEIEFKQRERVYNSIFYMNSPFSVGRIIDLEKSKIDELENDLSECKNKFDNIKNLLEDYRSPRKSLDLIIEIIDLSFALGITTKMNKEKGQILWHDIPTDLNIHKIDAALKHIESTLNMILSISGNKPVEEISHKAEGNLLRDFLINVISEGKRNSPISIID